jgi:CRP-like cAMP-binding protein
MPKPQNRLLEQFPRDIREQLTSHMKEVALSNGRVLQRPSEPIDEVYFPITCLISVTVTMADGATTEAGLAGSREMVGLNAFMGGCESTQTEYIVQVSGTAVRVPADLLLGEFDRNKALRDVLLRYTQSYIAQLSQNVACNRRHTLDQRLARWLLEVQDRLHSTELALSHEFIANMLGMRRVGITQGLGALAKKNIIALDRLCVRVLDVERLKSASCECFELLQNEYDRLLGTRPAQVSSKG